MALAAQERENFVRKWGNVMNEAYADDAFKAKLKEDPRSVLAEGGLQLREDGRVAVVSPPSDAEPNLDHQVDLYEIGGETGAYVFYFPEMQQLQTSELSEQQLEGVAAGACSSSLLSCCCC